MKLLVFAHTPPPLHGQSLMVQTLVEGLRNDPGIELRHVNARLSRNGTDIGAWRPGKFLALLGACLQALHLRVRHGPMDFYYVPAPGKRSALYRDWLVLLLCRPCFPRLVLHWHAVGLGAWLAEHATPPERWLTRALLGRADLSLVLAPELAADAETLAPRQLAVVPNGLADPGGPIPRPGRNPGAPHEILFLGLGSRTKGLFDTLDAVGQIDRRAPGRVHLTVAGGFGSKADEQAFHAAVAGQRAGLVQYAGAVDETCKRDLFSRADAFCFPTSYPHEGQPLTLIEALAHDVPIVTTRWRAIPGMLPREHVWLVEPGQPDQIAAALEAAVLAGSPQGALRRHYLACFTREQHLRMLKSALRSLP
jgi:glycosyltransferase involved in cell wall biosynthesis